MIFQVIFLATDERRVWLITSLLALGINDPVCYYACECFLLLLLLRDYRSSIKKTDGTQIQHVDEAGSELAISIGKSGKPIVPHEVKSLLKKSMELFEKNLRNEVTCDGQEWKLQTESSDLKIFSADYPGLTIKRWKVVSEVVGYRDEILAELYDFENRLKWDPALAHGERKHIYDADGIGEEVNITVMHTAAAGGGAVSSRELTDAGLIKLTDEGGVIFSNVSLGPEFRSIIPSLPPPRSDPIRGFTHPGGGLALIPTSKDAQGKPNRFKYVLVTNVELKGWLLTSVVNSATTGVLKDSTTIMRKHLERKAIAVN